MIARDIALYVYDRLPSQISLLPQDGAWLVSTLPLATKENVETSGVPALSIVFTVTFCPFVPASTTIDEVACNGGFVEGSPL